MLLSVMTQGIYFAGLKNQPNTLIKSSLIVHRNNKKVKKLKQGKPY